MTPHFLCSPRLKVNLLCSLLLLLLLFGPLLASLCADIFRAIPFHISFLEVGADIKNKLFLSSAFLCYSTIF